MSKQVRHETTDIVMQSNKLTAAMYDFTTLEAKAVLLAYSKFSEHDKIFQEYVFSMFDVARTISRDSHLDKVWEALDRLQRKSIKIDDGKGYRMSLIPLPTIIMNEKKGTITFKLNPDLQPYFLDLRREFTLFPADHAFRLQGKYSLRIYQLVMQWKSKAEKNHGTWVVSMNYQDLRKMFVIHPNEYKMTADFRKTVIERAMAEINSADVGLVLSLEPPTKNGKSVTHFNIKMRLVKSGECKPALPKTKTEETDDLYIIKHQEGFDYWLKFVTDQIDLGFKPIHSEQARNAMRMSEALRLCKENKGKAGTAV